MGKERIVEKLMETRKCDVNIQNANGFNALHFVAEFGFGKMATLLLRDINIGPSLYAKTNLGDTPWMLAMIRVKSEVAAQIGDVTLRQKSDFTAVTHEYCFG